jgi:signal peptidase II
LKSRLPLFWILTILMVVVDQAIKAWTRNTLMVGQYWDGGPWKGVLEFTLSYNKGIAFGMFQGSALAMAPVAIIIAGFAVYTIHKNRNESRWGTIALALLASGAVGNLIDRVANEKGVTDMFLVRLANLTGGRLNDFPVFNWADSCITVSMIMLFLSWGKPGKDDQTEPLQPKEEVL